MRQERNLMKVSKIAILLLLLSLSAGLSGCSSIRLYPIDKQDIVKMPKGTVYTCDRDGYFLSDEYVKEVMEVKVEKAKLK